MGRAAGGDSQWRRFCKYFLSDAELGFSLDISRVRFENSFLQEMQAATADAIEAVRVLEAGATANRDQDLMVGHYWLRAPSLAPSPSIRREIEDARREVRSFSEAVRSGRVAGVTGPFRHLVHIGIGGSALGPELLVDSLSEHGPLSFWLLDNADPGTVASLLRRLDGELGRTLVSVVSKSGITPTPMRVLAEIERAFRAVGVDLPSHAVATTVAGSPLDKRSRDEGWLATFPLWDWVGGRTSLTSPVGLLPGSLCGADVDGLLSGAAAMDRLTRTADVGCNPAALLALMWYWLGERSGRHTMVLLPYSDRLRLLPRYVQQLVMESVGKRLDRQGRVIEHGLTVYGNKGSSDQHSYFQQLRDGRDDSFVTFVRVRHDGFADGSADEQGSTLAEYLHANLAGSREALQASGRDSVTLTVPDAGAASLGQLVALFERTVSIYSELVDVNAYHQPAVDKFAADATLALRSAVLEELRAASGPLSALDTAAAVGRPEAAAVVFEILEAMARGSRHGVRIADGSAPADLRFSLAPKE